MRKLGVFNQVTLDGYFAGPDGDISWAHTRTRDPEWQAFVAGNAKSGGELVFGRITYEMMSSYWPTPQARANDPEIADGMNSLPKVVFSRTMDKAAWRNTRLVKGDLIGEMSKLKNEPGKDLVIFGSGTLVTQFADAGLIDTFQIVVYPIVLGKGRTMFDGVKGLLALKLTTTRSFGNGNVLLSYERP